MIICLSRDRSLFSWFTYYTDGGGFTHASIAFDEDSDHYYSFNFKGFKREYRTSLKKRPREMKRYQVAVTEEQYQELKKIITAIEDDKARYGYSRLGVSLCLFKLPNLTNGEEDFFCSQFVAKILDETGVIHVKKAYGNITPNDLGEELIGSGHVIGIEDDSTLKPLPDSAIDAAMNKLEQGKDVVIRFTMKKLAGGAGRRRNVPHFLVNIGIETTGKIETVYRHTSSFADKTKGLANRLPENLAGKIDFLLDESLGRLNNPILAVTQVLASFISKGSETLMGHLPEAQKLHSNKEHEK